MKIKSLFAIAKYDGDILEYEVNRYMKFLFKLFGLNTHFEIPTNIVLRYKKKSFLGFTLHQLIINKYRHGQETFEPLALPPFLLNNSSFIRLLEQGIDKVDRLTREGKNIGLYHLGPLRVTKPELAMRSETQKAPEHIAPRQRHAQLSIEKILNS